jgi:predicted nucleotidyltransferase
LVLAEKQLADFCRRWHISEFALFGLVLRDDFGPDSDLDVLVTFAPEASWSLLDHVWMERKLTALLSVKSICSANGRLNKATTGPVARKY